MGSTKALRSGREDLLEVSHTAPQGSWAQVGREVDDSGIQCSKRAVMSCDDHLSCETWQWRSLPCSPALKSPQGDRKPPPGFVTGFHGYNSSYKRGLSLMPTRQPLLSTPMGS